MNLGKNLKNTGKTVGSNSVKAEILSTPGETVKSVISNPIIRKAQSSRTTMNRLYSGYAQGGYNSSSIDGYNEILKQINQNLIDKKDLYQLFYSLHNILVSKMHTNFTAIGMPSSQANAINIKLVDKIGSTYSSRIQLSDVNNPISKCYTEKTIQQANNSDFLSSAHLQNSPAIILPLLCFDECLGTLIIGDTSFSTHQELYRFLSGYVGLVIQNLELADLVEKNNDIDLLTGLANHKAFQEELNKQIKLAELNESQISVCIFDISNISQINRDHGHAKGDEIIKTVAQKIKENVRNTDFTGRYGGDEIGIIMPDTSIDEAKYIAEYLSYTLSCIYINDVGPIKFAVGASNFPNTTKNQEKMLILAEQAMYISKSKSYENGTSVVVTTEDFDFWDDTALKSFAEVLTKRHAQVGIDFEDELVKKFHNEKIVSSKHLLDVVTSLAGTIDAKDTYTKGHSTFVSKYSESLARAINLPEAEVERIKLGAMLHDIGKIGIPENVLRKPSMLDDDEWEIMKQHPVIGAEKVLAPNENLRDLIPMVKFHHEHYDGSGYPFGLKGEDIPLSARIVAIADAFHALVSDRPYRKGLSIEKACEILKLGAGVQWDKELIRHFVVIAPSLSLAE